MSGGEDDGGFIGLVSNRRPVKPPEKQDDADEHAAWNVIKGQRRAHTLRLIRRGGKPVTIPYAYLPVIWGDWLPELVLIEFPGLFTARIAGDELDPLEELLSEHKVTRIREKPPVTRIDLIRHYPSREVAGDPRAAAIREPEDA